MGVATVTESDLSGDSQLLPKDTEEVEAAIPTDEELVKKPENPSDPVIDESLSDSEDEIDLSLKMRRPERYSPNDDPRKRGRRARKRYLQHLDYTHLMEYRMVDIEKRLKAIEGIDSPPPESPKTLPKKPDELLGISLDIKRMTFAEYVPTDPRPQKKGDVHVSYNTPYEHKPRHAFAGQTPYSLIDVI